MIRCPKCRELMKEREGKGHYGAKMLVYQCPECSGFWVDGTVVVALSYDSAIEVEADVEFEEISTKPRESSAYCPRCETNLVEQSGGRLPQGLRVDYCTSCHGFWFDKGELMIYKAYLEKRRQKSNKRMAEDRERIERRRRAAASRDTRTSPIPVVGASRILIALSEFF